MNQIETSLSIKLNPLPLQQLPTDQLPHHISQVRTRDDGHRPLLPLPIPIQRNRDGSQPGSQEAARGAPEDLVDRAVRRDYLPPLLALQSMHIDEWEDGQES